MKFWMKIALMTLLSQIGAFWLLFALVAYYCGDLPHLIMCASMFVACSILWGAVLETKTWGS